MATFGSGRNPVFGQDSGPPPPTNRQPLGFAAGVGPGFGPGFGFPQPYGAIPLPAFPPQQPYYFGGPAGYGPGRPTQLAPTGQAPTAAPVINPALPAAHLTNSTGGVGCEPGYNYFFPAEHTKVHVFTTGDTPPWQLNPNTTAPFHALQIPVNLTIADLLKGLGATNPDPTKNRIFEIHQGGNGRWYKGMTFRGEDLKDMGKTLKEVGWDSTRTGMPGGKPVVYLYVTKG